MKTKLFLIILTTITLVSCAGLTRVTVPCSPVNAGDRDFSTKRKVEYTLQKTYVLGIGGLSEKARNTNIIDQLMVKANLQENEALAYITASENVNVYLGIVAIVKIRASGYVVQVKNNGQIPPQPTISKTKNDTVVTIKEENVRSNDIRPQSYISNEHEELTNMINAAKSPGEIRKLKTTIKELYKKQRISNAEYRILKSDLSKREEIIWAEYLDEY